MSRNPAFRDTGAWRAEVAGHCGCGCYEAFPIGAWLRRDTQRRVTVLDGHQSAVNR